MFYVKETIGSAEITIKIECDNVNCHCPRCGIEQKIDIVDVLKDGEADLYSTTILCEVCTEKLQKDGGTV